MSARLDRLIADARKELGEAEARAIDWAAVDARLFAQVEEMRRVERSEHTPSVASRRGGILFALSVAVSIVVAVVSGRGPSTGFEGGARSPAAAREGAGAIVRVEGTGVAFRNGVRAGPGDTLAAGDVLEAIGGEVTVDSPGKLTFGLEPGSRVRVKDARSSVVLALEAGAVEARVVPVARGEALAIDVQRTRIAVHGTALRVALSANQVVVDLSEGVVAIGDVPLTGALVGAALVAPAHAEFDPSARLATYSISHDPAQVRGIGAIDVRPAPAPTLLPAVAPHHGEAKPHPLPSGFHPDPHPPAPPASASAAQGPSPIAEDERHVADAVRACMGEHLHVDNLTVLVSTTLTLSLSDDGSVKSALFDPPVSPEVNECAAAWIYRARFARGGTLTVPVSFKN